MCEGIDMKIRTTYSILSVGVLSAVALTCAPLVFGAKQADGKSSNTTSAAGAAVAKDPFVKGANSALSATASVVDESPFSPEAKKRAAEAKRAEEEMLKLEAAAGVIEPVALLEYIQTDLATANKLLTEFGATENVAPLRDRLEKLIDSGEAELIETCFMRSKSGLRMKTQSIREHIYPTEFDPPEIPQQLDAASTPPPVSSANPTAFDYRSVGATAEIEMMVGPFNPDQPEVRSIDVNIAPEIVRYLGEIVTVPDGQPEQLIITQPNFEVIKLATTVSAETGTTSLLGLLKPSSAEGQRIFALLSVDNLGGLPKILKESPEEEAKVKKIATHLEYISLDHREANRLLRKNWAKRDAGELRATLAGMIDSGKAELIDSSYSKTMPGLRTTVESVRQHIYPTEWDPAEIPQKLKMDDVEIVPTGANPTAFDTRNIGTTVELEPNVQLDGQQIDVNIAPEIVSFLGNRNVGDPKDWQNLPPEIKGMAMPDFATIKLSTSITAFNGQMNLLGLFNPPTADGVDTGKRVMLFIKMDVVK